MYNDLIQPWNTRSMSDESALAEAAREDPAAFASLYERYVERVYWYMQARVGGEDAQDLTQQVFLRALDALARYHPQKGPFAAWLFGIARHVAADYHRRSRRVPFQHGLPSGASVVVQGLEGGVMRTEDLVCLQTLLRALDPDKREILALRFAARLTAAEIGRLIGKSEAATQKYLARILQSLKEHYHADT